MHTHTTQSITTQRDASLDGLRIRRPLGLVHGVVRGRRFVHNPKARDALAILSRAAGRVLDSADGRSVAVIVDELVAAGLAEPAVRGAVTMLLRNGFVRAPGHASERQQRPASGRRFDLWVHVTNACNLRCPYCYIHKTADHLEEKAAQRILSTIEATAATGGYDVIHARYAGGEPMLRLAAMKAFHAEAKRRCEAHGVRFTAAVLSNGTALPAGGIAWLQDNKIGISVSIDGVGQTQDEMRPTTTGGGSFRMLTRCLDQYADAGIKPYILVTAGPDNLANIPELTTFLLKRGLSFRYSLVRDMTWGQQAFSAGGVLAGDALQRVNDVFSRCYDLIEADMLRRIEACDLANPGFRATHKFCDLSPWRPIRKACGAGETFLALGHDGAVSPCQAALHDTSAQVSGTDLRALAAAHKPFGDFTRTQPVDSCQRCRHAPSCAGGCPVVLHRRDGGINGRSPYCEVFRHVLPRIVQIAALELIGRSAQQRNQGAPRG
jgi:uncharacterized protein